MKRSILLLTAAAIALTPVLDASAAAKKKPAPKPTTRTVTWAWSGVDAVSTPAASGALNACPQSSCYTLTTQAHETKVAIKASSTVAIQVWEDDDYAGNIQTFCGSGEVDVLKGTVVNLAIAADPTCPGAPSGGNVVMTITGKK